MVLCRCRNGLRVLILKTAVITAAVLLSGCIQESSPPAGQTGKSQLPGGTPTDKVLPESNLLTEGATLFAEFCTSCHGRAGNGRGSKGGPSLQRPELSHGSSPAAITQIIRGGSPGGMPAFGHVFTPRQLDALSAYVLSLKK